jgi:dUTPase
MAPRSSAHKFDLTSANGVGVFDRDFCGDNDEYGFIAYNFTDHTCKYRKGDSSLSIIINQCENFEFEEVEAMGNPSRAPSAPLEAK